MIITKFYVLLYKNVCNKIFAKNEKQDSEISSMTHVVRQQIHQSEVSGRSFLYKLFVYLHYKVSIIYLSIKWMWDFFTLLSRHSSTNSFMLKISSRIVLYSLKFLCNIPHHLLLCIFTLLCRLHLNRELWIFKLIYPLIWRVSV